MDYKEAVSIYERAKRIVASDLSWSKKFDMIFSEDISQKFDFEWLCPDMDYEDDVLAFMRGFEDHLKELKIINDQIDNLDEDN